MRGWKPFQISATRQKSQKKLLKNWQNKKGASNGMAVIPGIIPQIT
jgi:hypothetical protein